MPRLNGRHRTDNIVKRIFFNKTCVLIQISLKFVLNGLVNNKPALMLIINRRHSIIWTNDGLVYWCIYASPRDELTTHMHTNSPGYFCAPWDIYLFKIIPTQVRWRLHIGVTYGYGYGSSLRWRHNGRDSVSNHQPQECLLNRLFRRRSKKTSKLRVTGLCVGNSSGTGEFPAQMASNTENVSI